jgi:hypothetical protein
MIRVQIRADKELTSVINNNPTPEWNIVKEFKIIKAIDEPTPEILIESLDTVAPKILHSLKLNFADLVNSTNDISEFSMRPYMFEGSSKVIHLRVKFLKNNVVDPETNYTTAGGKRGSSNTN